MNETPGNTDDVKGKFYLTKNKIFSPNFFRFRNEPFNLGYHTEVDRCCDLRPLDFAGFIFWIRLL